jgi:NhaP-type Na+/H+ or K+/H+ antiporter
MFEVYENLTPRNTFSTCPLSDTLSLAGDDWAEGLALQLRRERAFVGWMDPRGTVAGSTAATFSVPLVAAGVPGAEHLLPVTFLVIVGTVTVYGLTAVRVAGLLGLHEPSTGDREDGAGARGAP